MSIGQIDVMYEQIDLFSYIAENSNDFLIAALVDGLISHCLKWQYDFIEKLKENPTAENFIRTFCRVTYTYYFEHEEGTYGAKFSKSDLSVKIYKCGKNHEKVLLESSISDVIKGLYKEKE